MFPGQIQSVIVWVGKLIQSRITGVESLNEVCSKSGGSVKNFLTLVIDIGRLSTGWVTQFSDFESWVV